MSLLTVDNIFKEYGNKVVLNGASLRIERGERVALTGPNGAGKTTLIRIVLGAETSDSGFITIAKGTKVGYLSQELAEFGKSSEDATGTALQYEKVERMEKKLRELENKMQNTASLNAEACSKLMEDYSRLVARYEAMDGYSIEAHIKATLLGLGLKEEALSIPVYSLSGGERMRVAMARLLLEEPDLLILDEPTNHMDIQATEWLEGFLRKFDGGVLLVSHDRYFLDQVTTRVAELENGGIVERSGNYSSFIEQKNKMREFALKEQKRLEQEIQITKKKAMTLKGESGHRTRNISAWKSRQKVVEKLEKELQENKTVLRERGHLNKTVAPRIMFKSARHISNEIAKVEKLKKTFDGRVLFSDADFLIKGGERIGIIGKNGCGKTTLLNILLGNDSKFEGFARLGYWVRKGYLGQEINFRNEENTILEEIVSVKEMQQSQVKEFLAGFQFYGDELQKKLCVLSGGERVRLYLACLMLLEPDCLIMDEPTNHLDVTAREAVERAIISFKGTVIAVSHDRFFLNRCVNRILEIENGRINSYQGNYESYRCLKELERSEAKRIYEYSTHSLKGGNVNGKSKYVMDNNACNKSCESKKSKREELENEIYKLEAIRRNLEGSIDKTTPTETYYELDHIARQLEGLYNKWNESES